MQILTSMISRRSALKRISPITALCFLAILTVRAYAAEFPAFPTGTAVTASEFNVRSGMGIVSYTTGLSTSAPFLAAVDPNAHIYTTVYNSPQWVLPTTAVDSHTGSYYLVKCSSAATCSVATAVYNGLAYMAFVDGTTGGLDVVSVTPIHGTTSFTYSLVYQDNGLTLTSAPGMTVYGSQLIIIYGTNNVAGLKNGTYATAFNGSTWTTRPQNSLSPTQPALVSFNGSLYIIEKQDNSSNGIFVHQGDANGVYIPGTLYQMSGGFTGAGISGVVYNGNIVLGIQQDASSHYFYVFSSSNPINGSSWTGQKYPNIQVGATPALATFGTGISLAFKSNNNNWLFTSFATH
jgi:hypothetical protein